MNDQIAPATGITVNLSLISHTNAGKTTLARTLLNQDVGEVRDAAHVTDLATGYVMVQVGDDTLMLWDTPGFGDTARLLQRLKLSGNPIGWLLTQVWDRWRERPLWSSQQAVRNARERADVILYLVNAAEDPVDAPYVALEMEVLSWIGKPVLLLLNQMGPPRPDQNAEIARWRDHLSAVEVVKGALSLDAFARCWVQEGALLDVVAPLLPAAKVPAMADLGGEWRRRNLERFARCMALLSVPLALSLQDKEAVPDREMRGQVSDLLRGGKDEPAEIRNAREKLGERLEAQMREVTDGLIRAHGLTGKASRKVLERLGRDYDTNPAAKEGYAAVLGGLASGAAGGLAADLAVGGLTLGGGMIVGAILGALGAGSIARGYNVARGEEGDVVSWSPEFCENLVGTLLLRYLAVAHYGRGRGDYEESEYPDYWRAAVEEAVAEERDAIKSLYKSARRADREIMTAGARDLLTKLASRVIVRFYPESAPLMMNQTSSSSAAPAHL